MPTCIMGALRLVRVGAFLSTKTPFTLQNFARFSLATQLPLPLQLPLPSCFLHLLAFIFLYSLHLHLHYHIPHFWILHGFLRS
jgi:hypothetical protein